MILLLHLLILSLVQPHTPIHLLKLELNRVQVRLQRDHILLSPCQLELDVRRLDLLLLPGLEHEVEDLEEAEGGEGLVKGEVVVAELADGRGDELV